MRQIAQTFDEDKKPLYRFDPVVAGIDARSEFQKARDEAEASELAQQQAWHRLLTLGEWPVKLRQVTIDISHGNKSLFHELTTGRKPQTIVWKGREIDGQIALQDLVRVAGDGGGFQRIQTDETEQDFAVYVSTKPLTAETAVKLLNRDKDPRILVWNPAELSPEERGRLLDFAAYCSLVKQWEGKTSDDANTVINWVSENLQTELATILKTVDSCYGRGQIDALNSMNLSFKVAGSLPNVVMPVVDKVLTATYESRVLELPPTFIFRKEEAVKVINGIVKAGEIPKGAKPNQNISAAQNFGFGLQIMKKSAERKVDVSSNLFVQDIWKFIDQKLSDHSATMLVTTLYKNFMGIGGPKDYGLSKRMVQIYLLCLVKDGKVRVGLGPKSGLSQARIDYANIGGIEFSAKVLDALTDVQKMAAPQDWEILRPYVEKLLDEPIPATHDDAGISKCRTELQQLFALEKDDSARAVKIAKSLFEQLGAANPYRTEMEQIARLFATEVTAGDDITLALHALQQSFGYRVFEAKVSSQEEVDDLANRIRDYRNLQRFLGYDRELRMAHDYATHALPDTPELDGLRQLQQALKTKLSDLRPYIDSEVPLRTELIGRIPAELGKAGTLGAFIHEYTTLYESRLNSVADRADQCRERIGKSMNGAEMKALQKLEAIQALQPAVSASLHEDLRKLKEGIFSCDSVSRASIEDYLQRGPVHPCGLTFANATGLVEEANSAAKRGEETYETALERKFAIFLNPKIRERLQQGKHEQAIAGLLACGSVAQVRTYLVERAASDGALPATINRYLKKINVRTVKMAAFQPSLSAVEQEQIEEVVEEFRQFLEQELKAADDGADSLPVLQIE